MQAILDVIVIILDLYRYVLLGSIILSWLVAFNVINLSNDLVRSIWTALNALTEPLLGRIRRYMPAMGNIDVSPIVAFLGIFFIEDVIARYLRPHVF